MGRKVGLEAIDVVNLVGEVVAEHRQPHIQWFEQIAYAAVEQGISRLLAGVLRVEVIAIVVALVDADFEHATRNRGGEVRTDREAALRRAHGVIACEVTRRRSEAHTSDTQSPRRQSYSVCRL